MENIKPYAMTFERHGSLHMKGISFERSKHQTYINRKIHADLHIVLSLFGVLYAVAATVYVF